MLDNPALVPKSNSENHWFGICITMISAISFGMIAPFAVLSYAGGSNAITFGISRALAMSAVGILLVLLFKSDWRIPQAARTSVVLVVLGQSGLSIGILGAVQFIPVSLAILIMYIYPALVLIIEAIMLREKLSGTLATTCLLAFTGLAIVLGPSFSSLDWRGIVLGLVACISTTILMLAMRSARLHINQVPLMLWGNVGSVVLLILFVPLFGGIAFPNTQPGWIAFSSGSMVFVLAFACYAISIRYISAGRAAMIYNLEPLTAIAAAALILGETLLPLQLFGATLVIVAIVMTTRT